jgi:hypothetical protein
MCCTRIIVDDERIATIPGARFQKLYNSHATTGPVTLDSLRDTLDAPVFAAFLRTDPSLTLDQRGLLLWTTDCCYREINRAIIHDSANLKKWMPLVKLMMAGIESRPVPSPS